MSFSLCSYSYINKVIINHFERWNLKQLINKQLVTFNSRHCIFKAYNEINYDGGLDFFLLCVGGKLPAKKPVPRSS